MNPSQRNPKKITGHQAALQWASALPVFANEDEATLCLFGQRDQLLGALVFATQQDPDSLLDYSPESIQRLERWYFDRIDAGEHARLDEPFAFVELAIPVYCAAVAVRHRNAEWAVYRDPFINVGGYALQVRKGLLSCTLRTSGDVEWPHWRRPHNVRRNALMREFNQRWK